jgi:hypothetical protein
MRETVKNRATAHRFAFYPPVPLVRRASSFRPASAPDFCHRPASRPSGVRDTRCVQPTSATRTTYCTRTSRIPSSLSRLAPGGHSAESQVSAQHDRGNERFTTSEPLWRVSSNTVSTPWSIPRRGRHRPRARAWAFSSHGARCDRASDIPVASHSRPRSHAPSRVQPLSSSAGALLGAPAGPSGE